MSAAAKKSLQVEIFTNEAWESSYTLSRESLDKVYKYMDLLMLEENNEVDISFITEDIDYEHDRSGFN